MSRRPLTSFGCAAMMALLACSSDPGAPVDAAVLPKGEAFQPVAEVMVARCGSLDCHGSKYRNMRLYGFGGGRLEVPLDGGKDPRTRPDSFGRTTPEEAARTLEPFVGTFLYTHVDTEGLLTGLNLVPVRSVQAATRRRLIAAGGIKSREEVDALDALGIDAVVGMAIYTGKMEIRP